MLLTDDFFLGTKLYHKQLTELCRPLAQYLGITHAIYVNVNKQGRMFSVCTDYKWVERFLEEHYYKLDPLMVHPNNIHNGFSCDSSIDNKEFQDTLLYDAVVKFNWCNSFAYIEKTSSGGYFGFDFGTTKENDHIMNRLMNESKIVKKFIRQMHKHLHLLIAKDLQENAMDFYKLKGDLFYSQQGIVFTPPDSNKDKMDFLKEAGLLSGNNEQYFLSNAVLSPQEVNCLRIYLAIPNIKQVARDLDLAVTTATSYIENIKCKLNCTNKNDLLEKAELLESLGCI